MAGMKTSAAISVAAVVLAGCLGDVRAYGDHFYENGGYGGYGGALLYPLYRHETTHH